MFQDGPTGYGVEKGLSSALRRRKALKVCGIRKVRLCISPPAPDEEEGIMNSCVKSIYLWLYGSLSNQMGILKSRLLTTLWILIPKPGTSTDFLDNTAMLGRCQLRIVVRFHRYSNLPRCEHQGSSLGIPNPHDNHGKTLLGWMDLGTVCPP